MAIRFRVEQNKMEGALNFGRYHARTVKGQEVGLEDIEREIQENCSAKVSDVRLVMKELFDTIKRRMQEGQVVNLGELGKMYIAVRSTAVDSPEEFRTDRNITGFRCVYTPFGQRFGSTEGSSRGKISRRLTEGCRAQRFNG